MTEHMLESGEWARFLPGAPMAMVNGAQQFASFARAHAEAGAWWMTAATKASLAWQHEIADLAGLRLDRANEFGRRVVEAHDTSEVLKAQADYLRTMVDDYLQSSRRLLDCNARIAEQIWAPMQQKAEETAAALERGRREIYPQRFDVASS